MYFKLQKTRSKLMSKSFHSGIIHGKSSGTRGERVLWCSSLRKTKIWSSQWHQRPQTAALLFDFFYLFSLKPQKFWAMSAASPASCEASTNPELQISSNGREHVTRAACGAGWWRLVYKAAAQCCLQVFTGTGPVERAGRQSHAGDESGRRWPRRGWLFTRLHLSKTLQNKHFLPGFYLPLMHWSILVMPTSYVLVSWVQLSLCWQAARCVITVCHLHHHHLCLIYGFLMSNTPLQKNQPRWSVPCWFLGGAVLPTVLHFWSTAAVRKPLKLLWFESTKTIMTFLKPK